MIYNYNRCKGYIYIRYHPSYEDACKLGKACNIPERDSQYSTGELRRGYFVAVYEVPIEKMGHLERFLQYEFRELNIKYDGGIEFYNKQIIDIIEPTLQTKLPGIQYKKLSDQEINDLTRSNRVRKTIQKISISDLVKTIKKLSEGSSVRPYQKTIIEHSKIALTQHNKIYIELPTGGGKSYIVYNLLNYLHCEFIIIVSPRKIINTQNISQKYLQLLDDSYTIFNYSEDKNVEQFLQDTCRKILICCSVSIDKVYEEVVANNVKNIAIWFDEAHWGIEDRANRNDDSSKFWLLDSELIKYRIYTSASPNKQLVYDNEHIFGALYSSITVKELIESNWLSPVKPYVYSDDTHNVDKVKYMIGDFVEKERKYGFSFHNKQDNAFNLFYKHYLYYTSGNTHIRPYLLIGDNFIEPQEIILDYDYKNIRIYEETEYSIGYVVAKYSMGYDFNKIDFICLSDPKLSTQDIIQCIGRGIRPDQLGPDGSNKYKTIVVSLPVYIDSTETPYQKIIEVLKYLVLTIEIPVETIEFSDRCMSTGKSCSGGSVNEYDGENTLKSMCLDLLELELGRTSLATSYEKAKKIIAGKNIKCKKDYYLLCDVDKRLSKEPENVFKTHFKNWIDYLSIPRTFYDLETCRNKIQTFLQENLEHYNIDLVKLKDKLCDLDENFPPSDLWIDYYNIKNLKLLICYTPNKKINIVI